MKKGAATKIRRLLKICRKQLIDPVNRQIILIVLGTKASLMLFGLLSFQLFSGRNFTAWHEILGIWIKWDAKNYISLANYGYTAAGERSVDIVYFPLFPLLISFVNLLSNDSIISAFLISGIASVFLGILMCRLIELDQPQNIAISAVWFMFIFPTSYFLHIPYTESVFLVLVIGSFYFCRKKSWLLAGLFGLFACATRINGLILCLAIPFELWEDWAENRRFDLKSLWLALTPMGFLSYLALNYFVTGNFLQFLTVQREHWQKLPEFPWKSIYKKVVAVSNSANDAILFDGLFELIFVAFGLFTIIAAWKYLRNSYRVWMIASWLLFISTSWILSVPRYTIAMFPLFIFLAIGAAKNSIVKIVATMVSLLFLGVFAIRFVIGQWAF